jgi:hypothetical protein
MLWTISRSWFLERSQILNVVIFPPVVYGLLRSSLGVGLLSKALKGKLGAVVEDWERLKMEALLTDGRRTRHAGFTLNI